MNCLSWSRVVVLPEGGPASARNHHTQRHHFRGHNTERPTHIFVVMEGGGRKEGVTTKVRPVSGAQHRMRAGPADRWLTNAPSRNEPTLGAALFPASSHSHFVSPKNLTRELSQPYTLPRDRTQQQVREPAVRAFFRAEKQEGRVRLSSALGRSESKIKGLGRYLDLEGAL